MDPVILHRCSACNNTFASEADYIAHLCPTSGFTPADPEHQGADFAAIQKAALERGKARAQAEGDTAAVTRTDDAIAALPPTQN